MTILKQIFKKYNITQFGVMPFSEANLIECRKKKDIMENAKYLLVCLFPYNIGKYDNDINISKYAVVTDYHTVAKEILSKVCCDLKNVFNGDFVWFADNSPISEVDASIKCNLGVRGKNNLLINKTYGSYVFIGEIVTDEDLSCYYVENNIVSTNCIDCGLCLKHCPGGAIKNNGIDYSRCLSFITQKKGELTENEIKLIKDNKSIWGCDICQDICPLNRNVDITPIDMFYSDAVFNLNLDNYLKSMKTHSYGYIGKKTLLRNLTLEGNG